MAERVREAFPVGSLVRARGRDWVVLPGTDPEVLVARPLGGTDDEVTGIYLPLESVEPATFPPPDPADLGDFRSARLLRDALRLGFRETTAPLRCLAHIAVEPRPYQYVPLLMALKLDPVRLLIADDVGVGKTIEAALVARELLDRGEVQRLAVLCPPHLADQWQRELAEKFHIEAEVVLPGTATRLERNLGLGESLFDRYPFVVVSTDFIKSDRRWQEFVRTCPELVVVDEAHECADQSGGRAAHLRYRLVAKIAEDPRRHLILVTATPHSGKEEAFRNLLGFLDRSLAELPEDLSPEARRSERQRLARHFVQRRRADVEHYLATDTPFPKREASEETYTLSAEYKEFFQRVLRWCRERVRDPAGGAHRQRVRWWAALALLRAVGSSPAAAAATLRERAQGSDITTPEEADEVGRRTLMDLTDETAEATDVTPGADTEDEAPASPERRRLVELARAADALRGEPDRKLARGISLVRDLIEGGFHPIVFCKFIETAEYVAAALREALPGLEVAAVTGRLPHADRAQRVASLAEHPRRVLVATDCLSEGINLQDHFDAVLHYDLAWNPTRHEQREGRVDRFGQPRPLVRTVMLYGADNPIDGIVLDVLLRKHREIRRSLGVSVPVPGSEAVLEAILEGLLLRGRPDEVIEAQLQLFEMEVVAPKRAELYRRWDEAAERERRSRSIFAQEGIRADEVAAELQASRRALGGPEDVARFTEDTLRALGAAVSVQGGALEADLRETPRALRDALGLDRPSLRARFNLPVGEDELYLSRTHPVVGALASFVLDTALDPQAPEGVWVARRAGVVRTRGVQRRTTLLLLRHRFDLVTRRTDGTERGQLAEEAAVVAFEGPPEEPTWLGDDAAERLLAVTPDANVAPEQARHHVARILEGLPALGPALAEHARRRAEAVRQAHERLIAGARLRGTRIEVEPKLPPDVLGVYVYLPAG
jgi:superfamily II DNA or RNA helicase